MTPVDIIQRQDDQLLLDWSGQNLVTLDADNTPTTVTLGGHPGRLVPYNPTMDLQTVGADAEVVITASANILMKSAIEIRYATGRPVLLMEDSKMVGVIGDDEIYKGMLRQTGISG